MRFSDRVPSATSPNALTKKLTSLRAAGIAVVDLTETNPTAVGLPYPQDLLGALADPAGLSYRPEPFGLPSARAAVAAEYRRRGADVVADQIVLTASTSEAYTWLFKLLCNPGDRVRVPRPSYPLFEHLARLEGVTLEPYDLSYHGRWEMDLGAIARPGADVRGVVVVTPNNPTGSCVSVDERRQLFEICRDRGWALVADEVFVDYRFEATSIATDLAVGAPCLAVTLGGLSKAIGLPQLKLGWMVIGGPADVREAALTRLEIIADSFLSVGTPVQVALPALLEKGLVIRAAIHDRISTNLSILRAVVTQFDACDPLTVEGGWAAVIRVPATRGEDAIVLDVLERENVLVYPGFFFDFRHEAYLVVSLLVDPSVFAEALPRVLRVATSS